MIIVESQDAHYINYVNKSNWNLLHIHHKKQVSKTKDDGNADKGYHETPMWIGQNTDKQVAKKYLTNQKYKNLHKVIVKTDLYDSWTN